jgi:hypothetical protein
MDAATGRIGAKDTESEQAEAFDFHTAAVLAIIGRETQDGGAVISLHDVDPPRPYRQWQGFVDHYWAHCPQPGGPPWK